MKIRSVKQNNRKKAFEIKISNRTLQFPYSKLDLQPSGVHPIERVYVDKELASEAFTYELKSGKSGTVHIEQVLEYNQHPAYLRDVILSPCKKRVPGLSRGTIWTSEDFDQPLPDEFWLAKNAGERK